MRIKWNKNIHSGPKSASDFNEIRNDIQYDILNLFTRINKQEEEIEKNELHMSASNLLMKRKIVELENKIKQIEQQQQENKNGTCFFFSNFHSLKQTSNVNDSCYVDQREGLVLPKKVSYSDKVCYTNGQQKVVPSTLEVRVFEATDVSKVDGELTYQEVDVVDKEFLFDGNEDTFWRRERVFKKEECVGKLYFKIQVKLPGNLTNNNYVNTIRITPYLDYTLSMCDAKYKDRNGQWVRVDTLPMNDNVPIEMKEQGRITLQFEKVETSEIELTMCQPYFLERNGQRSFIYGFEDIEIQQVEFSKSECSFVTTIDIEDETKGILTVEEPTVTLSLYTHKSGSRFIKHELFLNESLSESVPFYAEIFQKTTKAYIKTTLYANGDVTPAIKEMKIAYKVL